LVIVQRAHKSAFMTFLGWYQVKLFVEHASGISMDALHILVGFAIFLLAARLLKRSATSPLPWLATLFLEIGNEAHDLTIELWPDLGSQLGEGAKDLVLTMALPTLVMLVARWRPSVLVGDTAPTGLADHQVADRTEVAVTMGRSTRLQDKSQ
jgi:hypothetical protein